MLLIRYGCYSYIALHKSYLHLSCATSIPDLHVNTCTGDRRDLEGWDGWSVWVAETLKGDEEERGRKGYLGLRQLTLSSSQYCLGLTLPSASMFACWLGLKVKIGFLWMLANDFLAMGVIAFCCVCKMWIHSFLISVIHSKELNPIYKEIGSDKPWK